MHLEEAQTTEMPRHRLKRNVDNIRELWREWTDGVDNGPSIRNLENRWGPDWRNWSTTESRLVIFYILVVPTINIKQSSLTVR